MTDRISIDELTSDQLDALQMKAARMEHAVKLYAELAVRLDDAEEGITAAIRQRKEQEDRALRAEAAIARVRALATQSRDHTAAGIDDYQIGQHNLAVSVLAALDGTEHADTTQPATVTDPAWTPPPPGDKREQLPDALLALIDVPSYTSTACEAATLLARQMPKHTHRRVELGDHFDRLHARCRTNNKFTGALCACPCHTDAKEF